REQARAGAPAPGEGGLGAVAGAAGNGPGRKPAAGAAAARPHGVRPLAAAGAGGGPAGLGDVPRRGPRPACLRPADPRGAAAPLPVPVVPPHARPAPRRPGGPGAPPEPEGVAAHRLVRAGPEPPRHGEGPRRGGGERESSSGRSPASAAADGGPGLLPQALHLGPGEVPARLPVLR